VAVELDGAGAVAVAEHAAVHLAAELAHLGALVGGGEFRGLSGVVEGLDFLGDVEVLLGDGAVGDPLWRRRVLELSECIRRVLKTTSLLRAAATIPSPTSAVRRAKSTSGWGDDQELLIHPVVPIPAALATLARARSTRPAVIGRPRWTNSRLERRSGVRRASWSSSSA